MVGGTLSAQAEEEIVRIEEIVKKLRDKDVESIVHVKTEVVKSDDKISG